MPRHLTRAPAVAAPPGQIDLTCQDRAFDQVHAAVARGAAVVVADFTATTFCDCSSMRALLAIGDMAAARGVQLRLAIPPASPVRRLAGLLGGDGRVPVYPGVREAVTAGQAAGPGGPPPPRQETPAMADITEVIAAHDASIARWQATFTQLARDDGGPASGQARAAAWAELAVLIELHLDAEDEICGPALCRAGPSGPDRVRGMREAHDEVREIIREARLQPAGSPPWQQLTAAALAAWASLPGRGEHGILDDLRPRRGAAAAGQPGAGQGPGLPGGSASRPGAGGGLPRRAGT